MSLKDPSEKLPATTINMMLTKHHTNKPFNVHIHHTLVKFSYVDFSNIKRVNCKKGFKTKPVFWCLLNNIYIKVFNVCNIIPNAKIKSKLNIRDFNKCDVGFVITSFENTLFFMMSVFFTLFCIIIFEHKLKSFFGIS